MYYLFENWNFFLAPGWPGFFLSTLRESLVNKPFAFKAGLFSGSTNTRALEIPSLIAPACPESPPPLTFTEISYSLIFPRTFKGCLIIAAKLSRGT